MPRLRSLPLRLWLLSITAAMLVSCLSGCQQPVQSVPSPSPQSIDRSRQPQESQQRQRHGRRSEDSNANFDYYLLNLSWSPEFCYTHPEAAECTEHRAFTLHGLWPQRLDGSYPEHCSEDPGPQDPGQFGDLYPDAGLLHHEWTTHGTCSGLDPDTFFSKARSATDSLHIPPQIAHLNHQISMSPDALISLFMDSNPSLPRTSLTISCGNNFLTAVEVCLSKQLEPIDCGPLRSCRANSIRIPPVRP